LCLGDGFQKWIFLILFMQATILYLKVKRMSVKQVSLRRINTLFQLAKEAIHTNPKLAQRYVDLAMRIAMRTRLHVPEDLRHLVCRHCKSFILPGGGCRVRIQPKREAHLVMTCLVCGRHMRIPLKGGKRIADIEDESPYKAGND